MVKITINGKVYEASENESVLNVALRNGIYIPHLCYHEKIGAQGKCRACLVKVEGMPGLKTSCNLKVQDGMVVYTRTDEIVAAQKIVVDLMLSSGIHDCLSCEQNGNCELQDASYYLGIEHPSFDLAPTLEDMPIDDSSEFILVDRTKCISCGRCVMGCTQTVVNDVLNFALRGFNTKIVFDNDLPMGSSSCVQCGECLQLCPVGAIIDKRAKGKARTWELKKVETVCGYCGVGCKLEFQIKDNEIIKVNGVEDSITNQGMLCVKGRFAFDFLNDKNRLTTPLIKENGEFREADWEEAIQLVASKFKEIKSKYGPDSIAGLTSAKCTNEENYVFQKFIRRDIGTNNVDHCARLCHSSTVAGLARSLGSGAMTNDIPGIKKADVIMIIGSDTSSAHPVIGYYIKQAVKAGTKLIVCDPKKIDIANYADIYVAHRPGTDIALINSIMHEIIKNGWEDKEYIEKRLEGYEEFKKAILDDIYEPENMAKVTGVPAEDIRKIAKLMGSAKVGAVYYAMGITQHTTGTANVWTLANLQMILGNIGVEGGGVNPLRGQVNVQGACDLGGLPNVYPGYQKVVLPEMKEKFQKAWKCDNLSDKVGLTVTEMIDGAYNGSVKAMYIMGENPYLSDPDQSHVEEALKRLNFLVVQDIFMTETAQFADVILPAAAFAEKDGHFTNTERRVQRLNKVIDPPGKAKPDWQIIQMIGIAMGNEWNYNSTKDILDEINKYVPIYGGITWERIGKDGLQWPCPTPDHTGTPILHVDKFARPNGKGLLKHFEVVDPDELPDEEYPLILTTGRVLQQFHTGTMTRKTEGINKLAGPMVMISIEDAEKLGIKNSDMVSVSTRRGTIKTKAFVTKRISKGVIYVPFHYHEAPANRLTNPALDPIAKIPEFKVCAAKIEKV